MNNPMLHRLRAWAWRTWQMLRARLDTRHPARSAGASMHPALEMPLRASVSVVIPALNEEKRIAEVVRYALSDACTAEVLVIDDSSTDATADLARQAGARVITSSMLGKGASMADGARAAAQEVLVFLDGDLAGLRPGIVGDLARPLLKGQADFVKARFGRGGGRVTELTAKPMLKVFFPELAGFAQPLGGVIAARRSLLQQLDLEQGYGVDVGLLIDAWRLGARIEEIDIGHLEHDSQPLLDLTAMANEISRVIYARAREAGRLHVEQITAMYEAQRQATASWSSILARQRGRQRLILLDMDGTVTTARFALELARSTGSIEPLRALLDHPGADAATRSEKIAALFRFVHRRHFEKVASELPLRPGIVECVKALKRAGFMVGLVSDSYFVAADIVRKRIFADFALAHTLQFQAEVCTGELRLNEAFRPWTPEESQDALCKGHVVRRFRDPLMAQPFEDIWAVGDNDNDVQMLRLADQAFAVAPCSPSVQALPGVVHIADFHGLIAHLEGLRTAAA